MLKYFTFLVLIVFSIQISAQTDEGLKGKLQQLLEEEQLTGMAWSVLSDSSISLGALGLRNGETGEPLQTGDKIQIGSVTKTLIATGILQMATQNLLGIDEPVSKYLPNLPFENPWKDRPVSIRDLLNHTSGLEDARFWQIFSEEPDADTPLEYVFTKDPSVLKIRTKPGTRFSYSNMGYTMLGLIIERVSSERYETYLDRNLLASIGMFNSTFHFVLQKGTGADSELAMGHFENGDTQESMPVYLRPAGQFTTTAKDMALFAKFLMSDGIADGQVLVDRELLLQMGRSQSTEANEEGLERGYQFGLSYRDRYGVVGYYHSGNIIGYRAVFYLFPEEKKAFFISFNEDSETADYQKFNPLFAKHLKITTPEPESIGQQLPADIGEFEGYYELNPVRFRLFAYLDLIFNFVKIVAIEGRLEVSSIQNDSYQLLPIGDSFFRKDDRKKVSHVFYKKDDATVLSDGLATYQKISPVYLGVMWLSLALGLLGFLLLLIRGVTLFSQRRLFKGCSLSKLPFLSIICLVVPIPFFFNQPFLALGDLTLASGLLAFVTLQLAISTFYAAIRAVFRKWRSDCAWIDLIGLVFLSQWLVVLIYWGLIPFRLWV